VEDIKARGEDVAALSPDSEHPCGPYSRRYAVRQTQPASDIWRPADCSVALLVNTPQLVGFPDSQQRLNDEIEGKIRPDTHSPCFRHRLCCRNTGVEHWSDMF